ncbi:glycosyltransferase [Lentzea sp. NPDC004789]
MALRIAVVSLGSRGDLYPMLGIGRTLRDRGHDVTVFEHAEYEGDVTRTGLRFVALGPGSACQDVFERSGDTARALAQLIRRVAVPNAAASVRAILSDGPFDAVVAHHFQVAGQLAAELLGAAFISVAGRDIVDLYYPPADAPEAERAAAVRTLNLVDRLGSPPLNVVRRELGLPERQHASTLGSLSASGVLILCPALFGSGGESWPAHFRVAGYPAYSGSDNFGVPAHIQAFVDRTELGPLIVCSLGDSWANDYPPTTANLAVLAERDGFRVLYLVCRGRVAAAGERCLVEGFAPLEHILPRADVIVHHAGRGSLMTGLRAGVPSLMIPHWLDGFENARIAADRGVGRTVAPDLGLEETAKELAEVLTNPAYRERARRAAESIARDPDPGLVAEELLLAEAGAGAR